jgi:hypothetical protein
MRVGGEFEYGDQLEGGESLGTLLGRYYHETAYFMSGRAALYSVLRMLVTEHDVRHIVFPAYGCSAIYEAAKCSVEGFSCTLHVYLQASDLSSQAPVGYDNAAYITTDYFGRFDETLWQQLGSIRSSRGCVFLIRDRTQSLLDALPANDADFEVASLRKWAYLPDGGVVGSQRLNVPLPQQPADVTTVWARQGASLIKAAKVRGTLTGFSDSCYLDVFRACEDQWSGHMVSAISDVSRSLVDSVSWQVMASCRERNCDVLVHSLGELSRDVSVYPSRFGCRLFLGDTTVRNCLRQALKASGVYAPVHWPLDWLKSVDVDAYGAVVGLEQGELTLPVDQRYSSDEMVRVGALVREELLR